jgi:DNA-binding CsgD family transcriptional regulator
MGTCEQRPHRYDNLSGFRHVALHLRRDEAARSRWKRLELRYDVRIEDGLYPVVRLSLIALYGPAAARQLEEAGLCPPHRRIDRASRSVIPARRQPTSPASAKWSCGLRQPATLLRSLATSMRPSIASAVKSAHSSAALKTTSYRTCRFLLGCDPRWYSEYEKRDWSTDDPWWQYARRHAEPIRARDIPIRTEMQAGIVRLAEQYGFRSTLIVPAPVGGGLTRLGMLCLGSVDPDRFEGEAFLVVKVAALPLAASLNRWCTERAREELLHSKHFSPEDLLLLDLQRQGMSTKKMADLTKMSPKSINSRFQRINAKLGVATRKAAARRAAEYGLI